MTFLEEISKITATASAKGAPVKSSMEPASANADLIAFISKQRGMDDKSVLSVVREMRKRGIDTLMDGGNAVMKIIKGQDGRSVYELKGKAWSPADTSPKTKGGKVKDSSRSVVKTKGIDVKKILTGVVGKTVASKSVVADKIARKVNVKKVMDSATKDQIINTMESDTFVRVVGSLFNLSDVAREFDKNNIPYVWLGGDIQIAIPFSNVDDARKYATNLRKELNEGMGDMYFLGSKQVLIDDPKEKQYSSVFERALEMLEKTKVKDDAIEPAIWWESMDVDNRAHIFGMSGIGKEESFAEGAKKWSELNDFYKGIATGVLAARNMTGEDNHYGFTKSSPRVFDSNNELSVVGKLNVLATKENAQKGMFDSLLNEFNEKGTLSSNQKMVVLQYYDWLFGSEEVKDSNTGDILLERNRVYNDFVGKLKIMNPIEITREQARMLRSDFSSDAFGRSKIMLGWWNKAPKQNTPQVIHNEMIIWPEDKEQSGFYTIDVYNPALVEIPGIRSVVGVKPLNEILKDIDSKEVSDSSDPDGDSEYLYEAEVFIPKEYVSSAEKEKRFRDAKKHEVDNGMTYTMGVLSEQALKNFLHFVSSILDIPYNRIEWRVWLKTDTIKDSDENIVGWYLTVAPEDAEDHTTKDLIRQTILDADDGSVLKRFNEVGEMFITNDMDTKEEAGNVWRESLDLFRGAIDNFDNLVNFMVHEVPSEDKVMDSMSIDERILELSRDVNSLYYSITDKDRIGLLSKYVAKGIRNVCSDKEALSIANQIIDEINGTGGAIKDDDTEDVYFRKFENGDVIALFPNQKNGDMIGSYEHNGQHSDASPELIDELEPASPKEYYPLLNELDGLGYRLRVKNLGGVEERLPGQKSFIIDFFDSDGNEKSRMVLAKSKKEAVEKLKEFYGEIKIKDSRNPDDDEKIYGTDFWPDGRKDEFIIGYINHERKTVEPAWGYNPPHPQSRKLKSIAKKLGYEFIPIK